MKGPEDLDAEVGMDMVKATGINLLVVLILYASINPPAHTLIHVAIHPIMAPASQASHEQQIYLALIWIDRPKHQMG